MDTLLISLHPRHSKNIFNKKKTIELRKRLPRVGQQFKINEPGSTSFLPKFDFILIYETVPTAQIVGFCRAIEVVEKDAQSWCDFKDSLRLTSREIWDYLGDRMGCGIKLRKPQKITPIPLLKMRELGIVPPQSYRYLSEELIAKLGVKFNG